MASLKQNLINLHMSHIVKLSVLINNLSFLLKTDIFRSAYPYTLEPRCNL